MTRLVTQHNSRPTRGYRFLFLALGVSLIVMWIAPLAGYAVVAGAAVLAWIRREPPMVRWALTVLTVLLVVITLMGWPASIGGSADMEPRSPQPPTPAQAS